MKTFSLEIVTPIKVIIEESVKYLRCPGVDGSFGVMHKHRNGVFALDTGEITIETNNGTSWFATSGGFAEITDDKVELLLESIEKSVFGKFSTTYSNSIFEFSNGCKSFFSSTILL